MSEMGAVFLSINPYIKNLILIGNKIGVLGAIALAFSQNLLKLTVCIETKDDKHPGWFFFWGNQTLKSLIVQRKSDNLCIDNSNYEAYDDLNQLGERNVKMQNQSQDNKNIQSKILPLLLNWMPALPKDVITIIYDYNKGSYCHSYPYSHTLFFNSLTPQIRQQINNMLPQIREDFEALEEKCDNLRL
jgi:hypothetical protein